LVDFFKTLQKRRSIRSFTNQNVPKSKLAKILNGVRLAPSSAGLQSYKIFIIKNDAIKKKLVIATHGQKYVDAQAVFVFCMNPAKIKQKFGSRGEKLFSLQDATIAAAYTQLCAEALGISSVWIGHFNEKLVKKALRTKLRPVCIMPLGYSNEKPGKKKYKKINELVRKV
jgi:nitroreductase